MKLMHNKKGNVIDIQFFLDNWLPFVISIILAILLLTQFSAKIQSNPKSTTQIDDFLDTFLNKVTNAVDYVALFIIFAFFGFSFIMARKIDQDSNFFPYLFVFLLIISVVSIAISKFYVEFTSNAIIATIADELPIIDFLTRYLFVVVILYWGMVTWALNSK